jgi:CRP-like cAMP-binding protein
MTPTDVTATGTYNAAASSYYDPALATKFFAAIGQQDKIHGGTLLFSENEKSEKRNIFQKPIGQEMFSKNNIHRMYLLAEGAVTLTHAGKLVDTLQPGQIFGEMAVISELPGQDVSVARTATATAATDCVVYSMDGTEAHAALERNPEFALMLMSVMFERIRFLAARLAMRADSAGHRSNKTEPLFDAATLKELQSKIERSTVVRFPEGVKIMMEGSPGTAMYIVLEGNVAVAIGRKIVEKLSPGGVFGEMALVDQAPRTASAVARSDCVLLAFNRDALIKLVKSDPVIGMTLLRAVAQRLRYMNSLFS